MGMRPLKSLQFSGRIVSSVVASMVALPNTL